MSLYVPLDADYYHDPKIIDAGPLAELLYVRGLCFAKRTDKDGFIATAQLRAIGAGLPRPQALAGKLEEVGAWSPVDGGWQITAWLKRNKSSAELAHRKEAARIKSVMGNHERWHVKEDRYDPTCEICNPYSDPSSDPSGDPKRREAKGSEQKRSEGKRKDLEFQSSSTSNVSTRLVDLEDDRNGHKTEDEADGLAGPAAYLRAIGGGT